MPKIPTYTAEGKQPSERLGRFPQEVNTAGGEALTRSLEQVAGTANQIAGQQAQLELYGIQQKNFDARLAAKLQAQKDDVDVLGLRATRERQVKEVHLDLVESDDIRSDPTRYTKMFDDRVRAIDETLIAGEHLSPNARAKYKQFYINQFQEDIIVARANERKLTTSHVLAGIANAGTALVQESVTMNPSKLNQYRDAYKGLVDGAFKRGFIENEEKRDKLIKDFDDSITEKSMVHWANQGSVGREIVREIDKDGGWKNLNPSRRAEILEGMRADEHREEVRTEQVMTNAKQVMTEHLYSLAYRKELPQALIDEIKADRNPLIKPQTGQALQDILDRPAKENKASDNAIRMVTTKFNGTPGRPTRQRAEAAKAEIMNIITQNGGIVSEEAQTSLNYINSQMNVMENEAIQKQGQALQYGKDQFKATEKPKIFDLPGAKNKEKIDEAEISNQIRRSPDKSKEAVDKIIKEHRDRQEKARQERSDMKKKADQLRGK